MEYFVDNTFTLLDMNKHKQFIDQKMMGNSGDFEINHCSHDFLQAKSYKCGDGDNSFFTATCNISDKNIFLIKPDSIKSIPAFNVIAIRPVLKLASRNYYLDYIDNNTLFYGEYPSDFVSASVGRELDLAFLNGSITKTFKKYNINLRDDDSGNNNFIDEYMYKNEKFVRVETDSSKKNFHPYFYINSKVYSNDENCELSYTWIKVSPVKWIFDPETFDFVCCDILFNHFMFYDLKKISDNFFESDLFHYLNTTFNRDLVPSGLVMTQFLKNDSSAYNLDIEDVLEDEIIEGGLLSDITVFMHGLSSDGKSARIKKIDPDCEIIYLAAASPLLLFGKSVYNEETGEMIDIKPSWLVNIEKKCAADPDNIHILFLDELSNALPSIQKYVFNIILDKEVNGKWKLPDNCRIVCAGNEISDSLAANELAEPLFNRCIHVYIKTTASNWLLWAKDNNIHPIIYTYIYMKKDSVLRTSYNGKKPNADPRKWELASKMLFKTNKIQMLRSLVGSEITDDLTAFCQIPRLSYFDVVSKNYNEAVVTRFSDREKYAIVLSLISSKAEHLNIIREFLNFLGDEYVTLYNDLMPLEESKIFKK